MPDEGPVVIVSGGGWAVGDLEGATEEALAVPDATVVCLCGRNDQLRDELTPRFAGEPRVRMEGFTEQMPDWFAAGDVLVHSTAGLTVLEAIMRGCGVVSYGWGMGHVRVNNEAFVRFGLAEVAQSLTSWGTPCCGPSRPAVRPTNPSRSSPRLPQPSWASGSASPTASWATAGELANRPAPAATATSAITSTAPPSGVLLQLSPPTSGAITTGITICMTSTVGATRVAAKR